jgi:hypothetical protein
MYFIMASSRLFTDSAGTSAANRIDFGIGEYKLIKVIAEALSIVPQ